MPYRTLCDRHYGVGGYGVVLLEKSDVADCRMRVFNRDGSKGQVAGNSLRNVGKYLHDAGTFACGSGACAAVVAAVENGYCEKGTDVTVKVRGGDLIIRYTDDGVTLTGDTKLIFTGEILY